MIFMVGSFQCYVVNLLLFCQIKIGGVMFIYVGIGCFVGFQFFLFLVNVVVYCFMVYYNIIFLLDIVLFYIIQGGVCGIVVSVVVVVVIFDVLIVSNQLGGVNFGVVVQIGISGLGIGLIFIVFICVVLVILVIVSVGGIIIVVEEF